MGNIQPFHAVTKTYVLTEVEASQLRYRLGIVRRQLIIEQRAPVHDRKMRSALRKEIDTLEHKLAHAEIIGTEDNDADEPASEFAIVMKNLFTRAKKKMADELQILRHA